MVVFENLPLKPYNTFGIEANAAFAAKISTVTQLNELLENKQYANMPKLILGGGSNILLTNNFNGLVLINELRGIEVLKQTNDEINIEAASGEVWHQFVMHCVNQNLGGIENLSLIPGSVGAGPMQNIGAYGAELKNTFVELKALHLKTGEIHTFSNSDCKFDYRQSIFKNEVKDQYFILSVTFNLKKNPSAFNISYGAIATELEKMKVEKLNVKSVSQAVINIRKSKLPDPAELGNAGSFFKNPEISEAQFLELVKHHPQMPSYNTKSGYKKLAAGWLIEQCGWKGKVVGHTGAHKLQSLVLVNYGGATGNEIYQLALNIQKSVYERFNVHLEMEVNII